MSRSLAQWVDYIQTLHPRTIDLSLERAAAVWEKFKPESLPPVIAVAGTNGKGSSVSMLESIYRHAGYRTAAFTSPHLVHFNERICLNNQSATNEVLIEAFERIEQLRGNVRLTFFEFNTLLALHIFCKNDPEVILLEVGMGGRLDAVNIVNNNLALITAIGVDHAAWLGDDREQIGAEKAGIIKNQGMAVLADPKCPASVRQIATEKEASMVQAGLDYRVQSSTDKQAIFSSNHAQLEGYDSFKFKARLAHQQHNTAGVIAAVAMLSDILPVRRKRLRNGLNSQSLNARLQLIEGQPTILLDVSHNKESIAALSQFMDGLSITGRIHAVFGTLSDKNYQASLQALKVRVDHWYLATLEGDRGQSAKSLGDKLFTAEEKMTAEYQLFATPMAAFTQAMQRTNKDDIIVIFGSFHLVGAIIPAIDI